MDTKFLPITVPTAAELLAGFTASAVVGAGLGYLFRHRPDATIVTLTLGAGFYAVTVVAAVLGGRPVTKSAVVGLADGLGVMAGMALIYAIF